MKNLYNNVSNKVVLAVLGLFAVTGIVSCDTTGLTDTLDDFGVIIGLEPINTFANVLIVDAATGELVETQVNVSFEGENGDDVIDIFSDPLPEDDTNDGILNFGLDNSVRPTESSPASIRLDMRASGYLAKTRTISVADTGGSDFTVRLVKKSATPSGVKNTTANAPVDANGATQSDFSVEANSDENTEAGASLEANQGTLFLDADENPLTGSLSTELTYFNPEEPDAMDALPTEITDSEGNPLATVGAVFIQITDANGKSAAFASNESTGEEAPVSYTVKLSNSLIAATGNTIEAGDSLNVIIGLVEDQETIKLEVVQLTEGGLGVIYAPKPEEAGKRFKAFAIPPAPIGLIVTVPPPICKSSNITDTFTITRGAGRNGLLKFKINGLGYSKVIDLPAGRNSFTNEALNSRFTVQVTNVPDLANVDLFTGDGDECKSDNYTVNIPDVPSNLISEATVTVSLTCSNKNPINVTDIPSYTNQYRKVDTKTWINGGKITWDKDEKQRIQGGKFKIRDVEPNQDYRFLIKVDTEKRDKIKRVTGPNISYEEEISGSICE